MSKYVDYSEGFVDLPRYMELAVIDKRNWLGIAQEQERARARDMGGGNLSKERKI